MDIHSSLDMTNAVEFGVSKVPRSLGTEFRWKIRYRLEKFQSSRPSTNKTKL
jgi:hypothetical protein